MCSLSGYVCLVTGASRGVGRGIAIGLGECGATVYLTGRTLTSPTNPNEGLQGTAQIINQRGGKAIPVVVDHSDDDQIKELFARIQREQHGRLDILVNSAYSAVEFFLNSGSKNYWDAGDYSYGKLWDIVNHVGLRNNYICAAYATRMMLQYREHQGPLGSNDAPLPPGLIVNISSVGGLRYLFRVTYGTGKAAVDRMSCDMAYELRKNQGDVCVVSLWPGLVRTELFKAASQDGVITTSSGLKMNLADAESPELSGRVVARLAGQRREQLLNYSGRCLIVAELANKFNLRDIDGRKPLSFRSVKFLLQFAGWHRLAMFVPSFIKIPYWILTLSASKF